MALVISSDDLFDASLMIVVSVTGERLPDGVSAWLSRPGVQPHARVLALGGRAEALLQTDPPRHGAHVPGEPPPLLQSAVSH